MVESVKKPRWSSEAVYRRTDNTMAKRQKKQKQGQNMIYKTLHRKLKIEWDSLITYYDVKWNVR
jgi:hypothetical protein